MAMSGVERDLRLALEKCEQMLARLREERHQFVGVYGEHETPKAAVQGRGPDRPNRALGAASLRELVRPANGAEPFFL